MQKKYLFFLIFFSLKVSLNNKIILIPHSHDDLGWNKTLMEYYNDKVRSIFDTVIQSLLENPSRKFVYSEVGYLKIYLNEDVNTRDEKIQKLKKLMQNGQWEFVNGGISQSDEACPYYEDIMENYFYGLNYLKNNFQSTSVAGWQIDPFGHSYSFAYFVKLFGMDDYVINRIPQKIRDELERNLERKIVLNWKLPGTSLLTHLTINHYSSPQGMDCDGDCDFSKFDRFQTDIFFAQRQQCFPFSQWYLHGNDFNYSKAQNKFEFTEEVMKLYDNMKYGLFTDYLKTVNRESIDGYYLNDFMVYQEGNSDAWSGYYTTKPDLKRRIRMLGNMLRNFKILISQNILRQDIDKNILKDVIDISENFGIFLHHDCITGTAKRYVDEDYFSLMDDLEKRMINILHKLQSSPGELLYSNEYADLMNKQTSQFKNIKKGQKLMLHIFNGYIQQKQGLINFVFPKLQNLQLIIQRYTQDNKLINIEYEIEYCYEQKCMYIIKDNIDGFNLNIYQLTVQDKLQQKQQIQNNDKFLGYTILQKDNYILMYNDQNEIQFQLGLWQINSDLSGAYILKYNKDTKYQQIELPQFKIDNNNMFDKLIIENEQWQWVITGELQNTLLLKSNIIFKDISMFKDGIDFLMSVESSLIHNSKNQFFTDSNGFFSMNRQVTDELEISVFPMNLFSGVTDSQNNQSVGFMSKFSHGVTLQDNKRLMIYLQRSTSQDDHKGVDQNVQVNDNFIVSNYIYYSQNNLTEGLLTNLHQSINWTPLIYYAYNTKQNVINKQLTEYNNELRVNVDFDGQGNMIVRLQNIDLQNKIIVNCQSIFEQYFNNLEFQEFNIGKFFNPKRQNINEQNQMNLEAVEFNPFEFKFFMAKIPENSFQYETLKIELF